MPEKQPELVLLFDGLCGFCDRTIHHILKHDKKGVMMFAPLQSGYAREVLARHPKFQGVDSMMIVERHGDLETAFVRSAAALKIASYLGGAHQIAQVGRILPPPLRDLIYNGIAKVRYKIFGKKDACPIPTPAERKRYVALPD